MDQGSFEISHKALCTRLAQLERILSTAADGIVAIGKDGRYFM